MARLTLVESQKTRESQREEQNVDAVVIVAVVAVVVAAAGIAPYESVLMLEYQVDPPGRKTGERKKEEEE